MKRKLVKWCVLFTTVASLMTGCGAANMMSDQQIPQSTTNSNQAISEKSLGATQFYLKSTGIANDEYAMELTEELAYETSEKEVNGSDQEVDNQTQNLDSMTLLEEKLVYYCDLDIETLDYAGTMKSIKDTIAKYNAVIQAENESDNGHNWYYEDYYKTSGTLHNYIRIRVPSDKYEMFLSEMDGVGKIISKSTSIDNISQKYYDTTTQIEALKIQEKNLLLMLEKCETIEDMITVQDRLSEVQYELDSLQTTKRYMDMDVAYSYVNINVSEVMEYRQDIEPVKKNTFVDRLKNTLESTVEDFLGFLEGFLFLIIHLAPYMVIVALFCVIFRKKIIQKLADRKADKESARVRKRLQRQALMQQQQELEKQTHIQQQKINEVKNEDK